MAHAYIIICADVNGRFWAAGDIAVADSIPRIWPSICFNRASDLTARFDRALAVGPSPKGKLGIARTLDVDPDAAEQTLEQAAHAGIDLAAVTAELEREGVQSFCDSYRELLACIESKLAVVVGR